jgi:hypothetical protein
MRGKVKTGTLIFSRIMIGVMSAIYLLFSIGIVTSTHYCMGKKSSVAYFTSESQPCACSLFSAGKDTCCDDEHDLIKLDDSQKVIPALELSPNQWIVLEELFTPTFITHPKNSFRELPKADDLPPPVPLFKFYCSLRFYDDVLSA